MSEPPAANSILFVGSSTIVNWRDVAADFPSYSVLNRGFGGSQASDVLYFFDRVVAPYRAPLIVYYEGDNDLAAGKSVEEVFGDWKNFVARVHSEMPNTHILHVSVKPSPSRAQLMGKMRDYNSRVLDQTASDSKLHFADVFTPMLNSSGQPRPELFLSDDLHMNESGYDVWRSVLIPLIDQWAEAYPIQVRRAEHGALLIDFGDASSTSGNNEEDGVVHWNNVTSVGSSGTGVLNNLVRVNGEVSTATLQMVSRFNGANENGTEGSTLFPGSATRDSLFGNKENFNGLANVSPVFKITGLDQDTPYRISFYASRLGVSDNRETRYTVTGVSSAWAELNVANNVNEFVTVDGVYVDGSNSVTIALTPGPNNNNANHFTYLGVLRIEPVGNPRLAFLFDFGAGGSTTSEQGGLPEAAWNDVTADIGAVDGGALTNLVGTNGFPVGINLEISARFNGANLNGNTTTAIYPVSATRDSLYGNTEGFNGATNVTPRFKLRHLNTNAVYRFTFYASRMGVNDNRETRYSVAGDLTAVIDLNASNNTNEVVIVSGIRPDPVGEISVALSPGPNNDNLNHFTYLGLMKVEWAEQTAGAPLRIEANRMSAGTVALRARGTPGMLYQVQTSRDLVNWNTLETPPLTNEATDAALFEATQNGTQMFFRLRQ